MKLPGHSRSLNTDYVAERDVSAEYISCFNRSAYASALLNLDKLTIIGKKNICRFQHLSTLADQKSEASNKIELKLVNSTEPSHPVLFLSKARLWGKSVRR